MTDFVDDKMNPEVKAKWLAALRSGKYAQGAGKLRTVNNEYCCLGVLCDVAVKEGVIPEGVVGPSMLLPVVQELYQYGSDMHTGFLPHEVRQWALTSFDPNVMDGNDIHSLSYLNDERLPFSYIADLIERSL